MTPTPLTRISAPALLALTLALPFARPEPAQGQGQVGQRPGITMRFVQLAGGAGGMEGRAYMPAVPANVVVSDGPGACAGGRWVELDARARTGHVRSMRIRMNVAGPTTIELDSPASCPSASIEATLDDGTELRSDEGTITVRTVDFAANPIVTASFDWSPHRDGHPMPFRGEIVVPAPSR